MAKGPIITDAVEAFIAQVYLQHPKWKASEVRNEVSFILHKNNSKLLSSWPSLSTVQKVLATVRRKMKETLVDPQEKLWSMGTLDKYPIPPETIPAIIEVWKSRIEQGEGFTIREAKWAARWSAVITDVTKLSKTVRIIARFELVHQLIDRPFDTTLIDKWFIGLHVKGDPKIYITSGPYKEWDVLQKRLQMYEKNL